MSRRIGSVAVFCGSNAGTDPRYAEVAHATGTLLAERGIALVYGGGRVGLMGIVADAALAGGGHVTGVIPQHLWDKEVGHAGLSELLIVDTMHERKMAMADRSDAFVALPGGVARSRSCSRPSPGPSSASSRSPPRCSTSPASTPRCWGSSTRWWTPPSCAPATAT